MTETTSTTLRQVLVERYDELRRRLARRLGDERARETLHETWLHLRDRNGPGVVDSPIGYLLRSALNLAISRERQETRRIKRFEVQPMLEIADAAPGPEREVESREQIAHLEQVLEELTPRRRTILLASRLEGTPLREIAARLGVSQRLVELELKAALEHCAKRFNKKVTRRFGPAPRETS
ncbi:sigma-70 family RNA polymerase sigma factor [Bradyrhizobium sp. Pear77]|uniref:RNA polymerase sigma factor n=1 Tax=Bradyrhizobium altum TaxID=1571202 RepID=UPI001E3D908F|nr:sigma-70 family RNA polymerase sigma factor [Bradyrhizobium altum]MCC8960078.1 sigma-70 family RNA polymerase sigma factor [Bradyrhizobium altum]